MSRGIKRQRKTLVRYAMVTGGGKGSQFFSQQMNIQGSISDIQTHFPYGLHANCTPNSTLAVVMNVSGVKNNIIGFPWNPKTRPSLVVSEVALYSPDNGQVVKLNAAGGIEITGEDLDITVNGSANITAADVEIDSTTVTMTGDLQVDGDITTDGSVTAQGEVSALPVGTKLSTHVHTSAAPGQPTSSPTPGS